MKWNHLPEPGGLYQQNPQLLDRFYYIFAEKAKAEAAEQAKQRKDSGGGGGLGRQARSKRGRR